MSEAKPQDGCTVKGYQKLTAGDIEVMDRQTKKDVLAHNKSWAKNFKG